MLKLYVALSGDRVKEQVFWQPYTEHATRRNGVVHRGKRVDKAGAEASLAAVEQLLAHLRSVRKAAASPAA